MKDKSIFKKKTLHVGEVTARYSSLGLCQRKQACFANEASFSWASHDVFIDWKNKKWEWTATASLQKQKFKRTRPLFPATLGRITRIQAVVIINLPFIILNNYLDINSEIIFQKNLNVIYKLMRNNFIAKLWKYLLVLFF